MKPEITLADLEARARLAERLTTKLSSEEYAAVAEEFARDRASLQQEPSEDLIQRMVVAMGEAMRGNSADSSCTRLETMAIAAIRVLQG